MKRKNVGLGILLALEMVILCGMTACSKEQISNDKPAKQEDVLVVLPKIESTQDILMDTESNVENEDMDFYTAEISDELFDRMYGKTFKEDCVVPREDLRYIHVLHVGFDGETKEGELVCHKIIADDLIEIFKELYRQKYQIERIKLPDEYYADDESQMRDNNSSCFNFRFISHTTRVSKHGLGVAVDINTLYNPYIKETDGKRFIQPATAEEYIDRTKDFPHKIDENDLAYQLFVEHGFEWGGSWKTVKDYQHFELPDEIVDKLNDQLSN